jgi:hypothetical protein
VDASLSRVSFTLENRTGDRHTTTVRVSVPAGSVYELRVDGRTVATRATGLFDYPLAAVVDVAGPATAVELVRR